MRFFVGLFDTNLMIDSNFMDIALEEARLALKEGEVPVGAVLVKDGKVIAKGHNTRERDNDISGHAEIVTLKKAAKELGTWVMTGCALYVTLEPCLMCAGAIIQSRLTTLVYGASDPEFGAVTSKNHVFDDAKNVLVYPDEKEGECKALLDSFFAKKRRK